MTISRSYVAMPRWDSSDIDIRLIGASKHANLVILTIGDIYSRYTSSVTRASMDQDIFRRTYREVNERFCAFEKGVLTNNCECSQAERFCIAEREGVHCRADAAQ